MSRALPAITVCGSLMLFNVAVSLAASWLHPTVLLLGFPVGYLAGLVLYGRQGGSRGWMSELRR